MPVHSLVITDLDGRSLFLKPFLRSCGSKFLDELHQKAPPPNDFNKISISINDICVVFQRVEDVLIFVSGTDEVDESICMNNIEISLRILNCFGMGFVYSRTSYRSDC